MKEFANVNLSMDAAVPRKLAQPYQTEVIHLPKEITFPLKAEYERVNELLKVSRTTSTLMGRKSKISVTMMTPQADHLVEVRETMVWMMDNLLLIPENMKILT